VLQVFLCALISRLVCARAQLRGNIDYNVHLRLHISTWEDETIDVYRSFDAAFQNFFY